MQSLAKDLPDAGFVNISALTRDVDQMLEVFGPAKDLLLSGNLDASLEQGAGKALELVQGLLKPGDDSKSVLDQLEQFFDLFRSLQSWEHTPPAAQALADFLGRLFVGVPADLLEKPYSPLRAVLDPLAHVLPQGPELTAWRGAFAGRVAILGRRQCAVRGCEYRLVRPGDEPPRRAAVVHRAAGETRPAHFAYRVPISTVSIFARSIN